MKQQILKLRSEGKSYRQIVKILGCSKGTVSFHCSSIQKDKCYQRRRRSVAKFRTQLKMDFGGKCVKCNYNRCLAALEFHHPNSDKDNSVSYLLTQRGFKAAHNEAKKCQLLCANCHREQHFDSQGNEIL